MEKKGSKKIMCAPFTAVHSHIYFAESITNNVDFKTQKAKSS